MRSRIHEMRNQLAVAVANIEAFLDGKLEPTPARLGAVLQALTEIDVLMNDLREGIPHLPPVKPRFEQVDVCDVLGNEMIAFEAAAQAAGVILDITRCTRTCAACADFACDPGQITQVVSNVLINAIKYSGRGGHVSVDCRREAGALTVDICDNGPGIPIEERSVIFERGVRGSSAGSTPGSGMGLSVVRAIVDAHGGSIDVGDSPSGGARFTVRVPNAALDDSASRHLHDGITLAR